MSAPDVPWRLSCAWCGFYVLVHNGSGAGEKAADLMVDHLAEHHPGHDWSEFIRLTAGAS